MENQLYGLEIELASELNCHSVFNEVTIRALISGLAVEYPEVFVFKIENKVAVLVVGMRIELLLAAFKQQQSRCIAFIPYEGQNAAKFLKKIVDGKAWKQFSMPQRLTCFKTARELSTEQGCFGEVLSEMVDSAIMRLSNSPVIKGSGNGWSSSDGPKCPARHVLVYHDLFYRFSIN